MSTVQNNYHVERITQYPLIHQGKVRDSFAIDDQHMLIVASDRLSAFDVVLPDPKPLFVTRPPTIPHTAPVRRESPG